MRWSTRRGSTRADTSADRHLRHSPSPPRWHTRTRVATAALPAAAAQPAVGQSGAAVRRDPLTPLPSLSSLSRALLPSVEPSPAEEKEAACFALPSPSACFDWGLGLAPMTAVTADGGGRVARAEGSGVKANQPSTCQPWVIARWASRRDRWRARWRSSSDCRVGVRWVSRTRDARRKRPLRDERRAGTRRAATQGMIKGA